MLVRLLGYVKGTVKYGLCGSVSNTSVVPRLHLYADADLAGDVMTMRSHSGHFIVLQDEEVIFPSCGLLRNNLACRGARQKLK